MFLISSDYNNGGRSLYLFLMYVITSSRNFYPSLYVCTASQFERYCSFLWLKSKHEGSKFSSKITFIDSAIYMSSMKKIHSHRLYTYRESRTSSVRRRSTVNFFHAARVYCTVYECVFIYNYKINCK